LRTGFQSWMSQQGARGWEVGSGSVAIGGWPRAATVTVPNLTLRHAGPRVPGDLQVASAAITLSVALLDPTTLRVLLTGPLHVRAGAMQDVIVTGDETSVFVPLRQTGPLSITLHGSGLRLEPASGAWHLTVGLLNVDAQIAAGVVADPARAEASPQGASSQAATGEAATGAAETEAAATFAVTSEAIALPTTVKWPLGSNISSLSFDGVLNGPMPPPDEITPWAEAWRDGGGSLKIQHLTMGWGPLGLTSSATLALDDQLQPMGSGNGHIVGYAETLDRLAAGGMLSKSAATAAKAVLSLMAGTSDADQPASVDVPLTLQYRTLSMRQVPLVRLPELDWPAR